MRVTDSLFYLNTKNNYQSSMKKLYDVNNQISSGSKIQNSYENSSVYVDTMRLNYEISTLDQVKSSSSKAQTFANNTDATMNQFDDTLTQFKAKLIQAANATNSPASLDALANDLKAMRDHLVSIANTSINGQFLFSGSSLDVKPINNDGTYNGNGGSLTSLVGSGVQLPYNVDGQSLFLGKDSDYSEIVSTNVVMYNKTTEASGGGQVYLKQSDSIQNLVGGDATTNGNPVFYLSGRKPNGETFNSKFSLNPATSKVSDLLNQIGTSFGNTATNKVVDVSLNDYGQIEVKDLNKGNSLLQMHIFGAIDTNSVGSTGNADKSDINSLDLTKVNIIVFDKSNFSSPTSVALTDPMNYSIKNFTQSGNNLLSNTSQIVKSTNEYATSSTKLSEVAGGTTLNAKQLLLQGKDKNGATFNAQIDLSNGATGTTFSLDGGNTNYTIFDANGNTTKADDLTYQQLNDVAGMITSNSLPSANNFNAYVSASTTAKTSVNVTLDSQGKMKIDDKTNSATNIDFSLYDAKASTFDGTSSSALTFMANDAVSIQEPHVDFFKEIDDMIAAVKGGNFNMDSNFSDPRNLGIQNSILKIDHISDHVIKLHTKIGSYSNALKSASERADFLSMNVKTVKSQVADVDIAEAYMNFTQLSNNYQAMLSTISKINSMSLLNYM